MQKNPDGVQNFPDALQKILHAVRIFPRGTGLSAGGSAGATAPHERTTE